MVACVGMTGITSEKARDAWSGEPYRKMETSNDDVSHAVVITRLDASSLYDEEHST